MGGTHAYIGFIEEESNLANVDEDFVELVKLTYAISGFGTHGVSCSGHFYPKFDENRFLPNPWGGLGFAAMPQMKHIPSLLRLISEETKKDPDARISIDGSVKGAPIDWKIYDPDTDDLSKYSFGKNKDGLYVAKLKIMIGDNGCLDSVPYHICGNSIPLGGNKVAFEKSQKRCSEIREFWRTLENRIRVYNSKHNFSAIDYSKKEFLPFY